MRTNNGRNQTGAFQDFGMYGTYAADMRYRQERLDAEIGRANPTVPRGFRELIGTALIRLGTRIEEGGRMYADRRGNEPAMVSASIAPRG